MKKDKKKNEGGNFTRKNVKPGRGNQNGARGTELMTPRKGPGGKDGSDRTRNPRNCPRQRRYDATSSHPRGPKP